jgi:hypothetical protein
MTYMERPLGARATAQSSDDPMSGATRQALVLVIEDNVDLSVAFRSVCECLDVAVERISTHDDLAMALRQYRPMAVVSEMDAAGQDGGHVLITVAAHDRDLPVLLITGDPVLLGAIDAVKEVWRLTSVVTWPRLQEIGALVDFLFRSGRKGNCMRLMPT